MRAASRCHPSPWGTALNENAREALVRTKTPSRPRGKAKSADSSLAAPPAPCIAGKCRQDASAGTLPSETRTCPDRGVRGRWCTPCGTSQTQRTQPRIEPWPCTCISESSAGQRPAQRRADRHALREKEQARRGGAYWHPATSSRHDHCGAPVTSGSQNTRSRKDRVDISLGGAHTSPSRAIVSNPCAAIVVSIATFQRGGGHKPSRKERHAQRDSDQGSVSSCPSYVHLQTSKTHGAHASCATRRTE